jgi:OFA family oxalate/formate antiporter-like MFS transporter
MLGSQVLVFALLVVTGSPWVFAVLVCWVLLCYGGGFGTVPSFIGDVFGQQLMSAVYGSVLTAWAVAGIVGPQIFAALRDRFKSDVVTASRWSFLVAGAFAIVGLLLSLLLSNAAAHSPSSASGESPKAVAHRAKPASKGQGGSSRTRGSTRT